MKKQHRINKHPEFIYHRIKSNRRQAFVSVSYVKSYKKPTRKTTVRPLTTPPTVAESYHENVNHWNNTHLKNMLNFNFLHKNSTENKFQDFQSRNRSQPFDSNPSFSLYDNGWRDSTILEKSQSNIQDKWTNSKLGISWYNPSTNEKPSFSKEEKENYKHIYTNDMNFYNDINRYNNNNHHKVR